MNLGPSWPWFHPAVVAIRRGGQGLGRAGSRSWAGGPAARSFPLASGLSEAKAGGERVRFRRIIQA